MKLWKAERKAINKYCDNILIQSNQKLSEKPNKFGVNMSSKKFTIFFQALQEPLVTDKFIDSASPYTMITLPKNSIWINGQELSGTMKTEYLKLMADFNIKPGPQRMIRMSKHTISVGDFTKGQFTGTMADYKNTFVDL